MADGVITKDYYDTTKKLPQVHLKHSSQFSSLWDVLLVSSKPIYNTELLKLIVASEISCTEQMKKSRSAEEAHDEPEETKNKLGKVVWSVTVVKLVMKQNHEHLWARS